MNNSFFKIRIIVYDNDGVEVSRYLGKEAYVYPDCILIDIEDDNYGFDITVSLEDGQHALIEKLED